MKERLWVFKGWVRFMRSWFKFTILFDELGLTRLKNIIELT